MGISKSSWCTKHMRGKKGHETSNWVQSKASFKFKVSYVAGRRCSRKDGNRDGERRVVTAEQTPRVWNHCVYWRSNLGQLPAWLSEWVSEQRGPGAGPNQAFCASSHHIPIIYGYLYSRPNWKVGLWTICMHPHCNSPFNARAHTPTRRDRRTALQPKTLPALTHRRWRPDTLHFWWVKCKERLMTKPFGERLNSDCF